MDLPKCIFCFTTDKTKFNTREHVLPESLGGGEWAILPDGLYCDSCQNKFGLHVEQQALADYPFVNMRTLLGIPTKKKKAPWYNYWEGRLEATSKPGQLIYTPKDFFVKPLLTGQKTMTIVPAFSKRPDMILRTLLKIGLETIAANDKQTVFEEVFTPARKYALQGMKENPWFYIQIERTGLMNNYLKGIEWNDHHCFMDVHYEDNGLIFLHLKVFYLEFIAPLVDNVFIDPKIQFREPEERFIVV